MQQFIEAAGWVKPARQFVNGVQIAQIATDSVFVHI